MINLAERLSGMIVLAGSVRENPLEKAVGRSLLNMPVGGGRQIVDLWTEVGSRLALRLGLHSLPVRLVHGSVAHPPTVENRDGGSTAVVEADPRELRGPGGVIADVASRFGDDELLLVTSGSQLPFFSIDELTDQLNTSEADVVIWTQSDGVPMTLFLVRCGALRGLPNIGFLDFKEQALPKIAANHDVRVSRFENSSIWPVRTMNDYLLGLRQMHRTEATHPSSNLGRWDDPWQPVFSLVEPGASVAPAADLFDSVVLSGGEVGAGAIVVRSVVCPGGVVAAKGTVMDMVVSSSS